MKLDANEAQVNKTEWHEPHNLNIGTRNSNIASDNELLHRGYLESSTGNQFFSFYACNYPPEMKPINHDKYNQRYLTDIFKQFF
jgi:hypothetical protein